ncbi:YhdP family protein [Celerinatantimonas diazotrophica]|uniref:Uncharacterized protein (TIGR02099 family) n=1 Tax=Celerinatantimonas diazotrophica TaxID=412034 RepID=A0A4R1KGP5_9GAMM|nr:YhdP family protein [Celerinatantimonas diazotrophica]TCK63213.1 uncharacterized protein (TIGR02099 family) [Celerinatantimonas diazotrophica]CAG9295582.1 hypothetical protein CEDIAZO_00702 [Celerinatantimonas diazotrophica]
MAPLLRRIAHHCWLTLAIIIIAAAVLLSVLRGFFVYANDFRDEMTQWLTGYSAQQLQIGSMSASLEQFHPILILKDVRFSPQNSSRYQLKMRSILLDFSLLNSLKQGHLVFRNIQLNDVNATLPWVQHNGTDKSSHPVDISVAKTFAKLFLHQLDHFQVKNAQINFLAEHNQSHKLYIKSMFWRNQGHIHQAEGDAYLPHFGQSTSTIHFALKLDNSGGRHHLLDIPGQFYAQGKHIQLSRIGHLLNVSQLMKFNTDLNFKLWGKFGGKQPALWQWQWQPSTLDWQNPQGHKHHLSLDKGVFTLRDKGDYYQVDSSDLSLKTDGKSWGNVTVQGALNSQAQHWYINQLPMAEMEPLISLLPKPQQMALVKIKTGQFQDIRLRYNWRDGQLNYRTQVHNFSSQATGVWPGVTGLSAKIEGDQRHLNFSVGLGQSQVNFKHSFDQSWPIESLSAHGQVSWANAHPVVRLDRLVMQSPWLNVNALGVLSWQDDQASPWLSLSAQLNLPDAGKAHHFYPHPLMPENVANYLKASIQSGSVKDAQLLWFGRVNHFPYRAHQGIFQVYVPLRHSTFKFQPDWPALTDMDLNLLFQDDSLHMASDRANIAGIPIKHIDAAIEEMNSQGKVQIQAQLHHTDLTGVHQLLEKSPVTSLVSTMQQLPMSAGTLSGQLLLDIPLDNSEVKVAGYADFKDAAMQVKTMQMDLDSLNGRLFFQQGNLSAHNLHAQWLGQPLAIDIGSEQVNPSKYHLGIGLSGHWDMRSLQKQLSNPKLLKPASGQLNWQGQINIAFLKNSAFQYNAKFSSQLAQFKLALAKPFDKSANQSWPTTLNVSGDDQSGHGSLSIEDRLESRFHYLYQPFHLDQLRLNVGNAQSLPHLSEQLPEQGSVINANIDKTRLKPWLDYILPMISSASSVKSHAASESDSDHVQNVSLLPDLKSIHILAQQLDAFSQPLDQMQLDYQQTGHVWKINSQQLNGSFIAPVKPSLTNPWRLNIVKATLPQLDLSALKSLTHSPSVKGKTKPAAKSPMLMPIEFECQSCQIGRYRLGQLNVVLPFANGQMKNGKVTMHGVGGMKLDATVNWLPGPGGMTSFYQGTFKTKETGKFLASLGFAKELEQTPMKGSFGLRWHGLPYQIDKKTLNGQLKWKAGEGVLTDVSDKGARLFTLASLDTLRRRLKLDFRDIFDKGLYFNSAKASATITNGVLKNDDYYMDAVSGILHGHGELNLISGQVNYHVSFSPKITSSLPVLAAFAVTPVTGAAVLALSKLLEPVIDVITQVDFDITGDIDHPKLIEVKREKRKIKVPVNLQGRPDGSN